MGNPNSDVRVGLPSSVDAMALGSGPRGSDHREFGNLCVSASCVRASVTGTAIALIGVQRLSHDQAVYVDVVT